LRSITWAGAAPAARGGLRHREAAVTRGAVHRWRDLTNEREGASDVRVRGVALGGDVVDLFEEPDLPRPKGGRALGRERVEQGVGAATGDAQHGGLGLARGGVGGRHGELNASVELRGIVRAQQGGFEGREHPHLGGASARAGEGKDREHLPVGGLVFERRAAADEIDPALHDAAEGDARAGGPAAHAVDLIAPGVVEHGPDVGDLFALAGGDDGREATVVDIGAERAEDGLVPLGHPAQRGDGLGGAAGGGVDAGRPLFTRGGAGGGGAHAARVADGAGGAGRRRGGFASDRRDHRRGEQRSEERARDHGAARYSIQLRG
jgi:hypothetical protein